MPTGGSSICRGRRSLRGFRRSVGVWWSSVRSPCHERSRPCDRPKQGWTPTGSGEKAQVRTADASRWNTNCKFSPATTQRHTVSAPMVGEIVGKKAKRGWKPPICWVLGGSGEIRTHGGVAPTAVFKTAALNRSATLPLRAPILGGFAGRPGRGWRVKLPAAPPAGQSIRCLGRTVPPSFSGSPWPQPDGVASRLSRPFAPVRRPPAPPRAGRRPPARR